MNAAAASYSAFATVVESTCAKFTRWDHAIQRDRNRRWCERHGIVVPGADGECPYDMPVDMDVTGKIAIRTATTRRAPDYVDYLRDPGID